MVVVDHQRLSIVKHCGLLGIGRLTYDYRPKGESTESLALMRLMNAKYLQSPCFGSSPSDALVAPKRLLREPQARSAVDGVDGT